MMLAIGGLSLVVPDAPTPWPARIIDARLDNAVPAYETGELTRADWPLRLLTRRWNESICIDDQSMNVTNCSTV